MEKITRKLAHEVSLSLGYDAEKEAVVTYGLIIFIQIAITTLLVLVFGILIGVPFEAMIVCFSVSILRKFSGGAHAGTAEFCTCFTVVYCSLTAFMSKLLSGIYSQILMGIAILAVFALSFNIIYKLAPVDSPKKPIRTEQKKKKMKNGSLIVLTVYLLISAAFFFLSNNIEVFKSYGISLLFGVSWQCFTLTSFGAQFIQRMNQTIRI